MKKVRIFILLIFIIIPILLLYKNRLDKKAKRDLTFTYPRKRTIEQTVSFAGNIVPEKEVEIKTQISGVLEDLFVEVGDTVNAGDKLAIVRLVSDPLSIQKLENQYSISMANLRKANADFERQQYLFKSNAISRTEYEEAERQAEIFKHEILSLKTELDLLKGVDPAKKNLNVITATVGGVVLELPLETGSSVTAVNSFNPGTTIARLADLKTMIFKGYIGESDIHFLRANMNVQIEVFAFRKRRLQAILDIISPKGILKDGAIRFEVLANITENADSLSFVKAGYSAYAHIVVNKRDSTLSVDEKFLAFSGDTVFVNVENSDGFFSPRQVQTGISNGVFIEVLSGLTRDDKIILTED